MDDPSSDDGDEHLTLLNDEDGTNGSVRGAGGNRPRDSEGRSAAARSSAPSNARHFILHAALCEFGATFFLCFLALAGLYSANSVGADALSTGSLTHVALAYGLSDGCLVYCFSSNGGGVVPSIRSMNPALTLALYLAGKVDGVRATVTVFAQSAGAIAGSIALFLCFNATELRTYELFDGANVWQRLTLSALVSFLSCFLMLITNFAVVQPSLQASLSADSSEQAPQTVHELNSIVSALVSTVCAAIASPITGCFANPLFAVTVLAVTHWQHSVLVVVLGPLIGALFAALAARLFTYRTRAPFLTNVRWGAGGMGGLGLSSVGPAHPMAAVAAGVRQNHFQPPPARTEEKQGSRF